MKMTPERAANLLRDDSFSWELEQLKQTFISQIVNSTEHELDTRENAYRIIRAIDLIKSHFQAIAETTEIKAKRLKIF
jgi:hypothetical protein